MRRGPAGPTLASVPRSGLTRLPLAPPAAARYGRQLTVVGYADEYTRKRFEKTRSRSLCLVKPDGVKHLGKVRVCAAGEGGGGLRRPGPRSPRRPPPQILTHLADAGFTLSNLRSMKLNERDASELVGFAGAAHVASDVCVAVEVVGEEGVAQLRALAGPDDPAAARRENPRSLRAQLGTSAEANAVHVSESAGDAERELSLVFGEHALPSARATTATLDSCTCCVIRPHAVREGTAGAILDAIQKQGFEVSALQLFHLDKAAAEEFLEVYRGVVREYSRAVEELCSGPCIALEVRAEDAVPTFREFAGPFDVEIAQHIRRATLRAQFGHDRVCNAVHCTDLPEDGRLECEYFFHILQK